VIRSWSRLGKILEFNFAGANVIEIDEDVTEKIGVLDEIIQYAEKYHVRISDINNILHILKDHGALSYDLFGENVRVPFAKILSVWNENRGDLPSVVRLTEVRKTHIRARWKQYPDINLWIDAVKRIAASDFCVGKNSQGWSATFDFMLQESKFAKILEGVYDNRGKKDSLW
jgi:hypothetical protein